MLSGPQPLLTAAGAEQIWGMEGLGGCCIYAAEPRLGASEPAATGERQRPGEAARGALSLTRRPLS